ncbi:MAG TPA: hypothetical protein VNL71_19755 [Chloroflexota bacterium]|nr:hypothetical protein [Chloroflexota bacterium]
MGEDQGATVMTLLRDAGVSLLRRAGRRQIAACLRAHNQDPAPRSPWSSRLLQARLAHKS